MVSTVTTSVTSVTTSITSAAMTGGEIVGFSLMAAMTLVVFLSFQEITASGSNLFLQRLSRTANTAVLPLLFAVAATVAIRIAFVL